MDDAGYMAQALKQARKGLGRTSPNPAVGAVVVKGGRVVSTGHHKRAGGPHAEIEALRGLSPRRLKGATLFVTLEPCCHHGRTPPCTEAVIASGVRSVVVGATDPNPLVAGRGVKALKAAGIRVATGVLEKECRAVNAWYEKYITEGLPYVTLKLAGTLDGRSATASGESRWITGKEARRLVHRMRAASDAVMVGAGTAIADDPALDVRHVRGRDPLRVVLDSNMRTPVSARLFTGLTEKGAPGLVFFTAKDAPSRSVEAARQKGAEVIGLPRTKDGVSVRTALKRLASRGVATVLVEGGGTLAASLLKAGLVDRVSYFIAPVLLGADALPSVGPLMVKRLGSAIRLEEVSTRRVGDDILVEGVVNN